MYYAYVDYTISYERYQESCAVVAGSLVWGLEATVDVTLRLSDGQ